MELSPFMMPLAMLMLANVVKVVLHWVEVEVGFEAE
jgi:hypothetical protein